VSRKITVLCLLTHKQGIDASVFTAGIKPDMRSISSVVPAPVPSVTQPDTSTETRKQQEQRALKFQTHTTSKFSKEDLGNASVIGQVDCKFVACLLPGDSTDEGGPVIILIDQHAADERIRVERFLKELCDAAVQGDAESIALDAKKGVVLTRDEASLLQQNEVVQELRRWGLRLEPVEILESLTAAWMQVDVLAVPALLRDKVSLLTSF
jgi:DNA mismatch repair ATPase MutL